ncbi:MAG: flippase-like domain-containing protein [Candidatus Obscuribacterales bacterium]|nr:flippase-like domain-containing protein [Candidatus Obscuribacterales bacterium]
MVTSELSRADKPEVGDTDATMLAGASTSNWRALERAAQIRQKMSKATKFKLKVLVSIIMFVSLFVFGKVDLAKTWDAAMHANRWYLGGTVALFLLSIAPMARRWQLLANSLGLPRPFMELLRYYLVGSFFNLFLPSTVGGDVSRCYYLAKGTNLHKESFYSVLADRASGIAVLFLCASIGIGLSSGGASLPWQLKWPIYAGTFGTFIVLPFMPYLTRAILGEKNWLTRQFNESAAKIFWQDRRLIPVSLCWSFVSQIILVLCHVGVGLSLGLNDIPLWYYFVFYPSVAVLGFITPSFNGIGIREWAYTYFLLLVGVDKAHALTYALMWLGLTTFGSLLGGVVYMTAHMKPPPKELED